MYFHYGRHNNAGLYLSCSILAVMFVQYSFHLTKHITNTMILENTIPGYLFHFVHFVYFSVGLLHVNRHPTSIRLCNIGFYSSKVALLKWSKRGQTSLVIPGHDPPLDITVFMDSSVNPGPNGLNCIDNGELHVHGELHSNLNNPSNIRQITYSHSQLFNIRRSSQSFIDSGQLHMLKMIGILWFRVKRAGKRNRHACKITQAF